MRRVQVVPQAVAGATACFLRETMSSNVSAITEIDCDVSLRLLGDGKQPRPDAILALVLRGLMADWSMVRAARASAHDAEAYSRRFHRADIVLTTHAMPETGGRIFYNDDLSGFNFSAHMARFDQVLEALRAHLSDPAPPTFYVGSTTVDTCRLTSAPRTTSTSATAIRWPASGSATAPEFLPTTTCLTI
jgi:hypothetical protein